MNGINGTNMAAEGKRLHGTESSVPGAKGILWAKRPLIVPNVRS